jgi:hypothetical protein
LEIIYLALYSDIVVYDFKLTGTWQDSWLLMAIEYLPLVILLIIQWFRWRKSFHCQCVKMANFFKALPPEQTFISSVDPGRSGKF